MGVKELRINGSIGSPNVRLIDETGAQLGVFSTQDALQKARTKNLDLVEVAPNAKPPVCKILNYGKYKFEQKKRKQDSRRSSAQVLLKEIRMQPRIEQHDLGFKTRKIREFLNNGNKVKVIIRFRGRELTYTHLGREVLEKVLEEIGDASCVDKPPTMEGRFMSMIIRPHTK